MKKFLNDLEKNTLSSVNIFTGDNAFFEKVLRNSIEKSGWKWNRYRCQKKGPEDAFFESSQSMGLFSEKEAHFLLIEYSPRDWSRARKESFEKLTEGMASDPDRLLLVQWKSKAKAKTYFPKDSGYYDWKVKANEVGNWIVHMGRTRQYELSQQKIRFLSELSDDLLQLDNWIELWSLGGDLWASQNLGWRGKSSANTSGSANSQSPIIFQWVDAVLAGNAQKALLLLNQCFEDGSEAIALNGLLAKSLRALVAIKFGEDLSAFHPYQVSRLKRMRVPHLDALLQKSAEIDLKLKSTSADARALIDQLCRLPHS